MFRRQSICSLFLRGCSRCSSWTRRNCLFKLLQNCYHWQHENGRVTQFVAASPEPESWRLPALVAVLRRRVIRSLFYNAIQILVSWLAKNSCNPLQFFQFFVATHLLSFLYLSSELSHFLLAAPSATRTALVAVALRKLARSLVTAWIRAPTKRVITWWPPCPFWCVVLLWFFSLHVFWSFLCSDLQSV